jgi:hypothetical protein
MAEIEHFPVINKHLAKAVNAMLNLAWAGNIIFTVG